MVSPLQNPVIAHQLNQAYLAQRGKEARLKKEREEEARLDRLQDSESSRFWHKVSKAAMAETSHLKTYRDVPEDRHLFAAIQAVLNSENASRKIIGLIVSRIAQLVLPNDEEVFERANYYIAPFCPPLNAKKLRRQFYMSYLKFQKDRTYSTWVTRIQEGDSAIYRTLLLQLRLILSDFFARHFKAQLNARQVSDEILILVDKALPTFDLNQSFFSWFFSIVKTKLLSLQKMQDSTAVLANRNVEITESKLAYLAIQNHPEGFF
jgi:hypothetical protein